MADYVGEFHITVDRATGRIVIPNDFRIEMESYNQKIFYLVRGTRGNVQMIPSQLWDELRETLSKEPVFNPVSQKVRSFLVGGSARIQVDGQYRMTLPGWVRDHAKISDTAVLIGCGVYLELWGEKSWQEFISSEEVKVLIDNLLLKLFPSKLNDVNNDVNKDISIQRSNIAQVETNKDNR
ncbi:MAG: hypothetical protein N3G21_08130 [Candidatus Hydrogenedentes bacterium]|nr:hypothetical protein [Candidatus Hydrogenedentota bacterium]